jgi:type IV pilus assembly protein PilX
MKRPDNRTHVRVSLNWPEAQRGSALIMGLIMLLVITMLGLTAMQTTTQQERMAGNLRDRNIAFQAAEIALRQGEEALMNRCIEIFDGDGAYDVEANTDAERSFVEQAATVAWTDVTSYVFDDFSKTCVVPVEHAKVDQSAAVPRYFVERQPAVAGPSLETGVAKTIEVFKVTSLGVGGSDAAVVVLQSSFKRD